MFDTKIGKIFFIGIGGIGMSGIAEVLVNQRFEVAVVIYPKILIL